MSNDTLVTIYNEIFTLQQLVTSKAKINADERNLLNTAEKALRMIQYLPRTIVVTPATPEVRDENNILITPQQPAVTEQLFDIIPMKPNLPDEEISTEEIKETFEYWTSILNS